METTDKEILHIALPAIVTNITVPLLGLVDAAIVGHMGAPAYIGAVAVGAMIFNLVYWVFGFLRMGTSGLTAQAFGRGDTAETVRLLLRSASVAAGVSLLLFMMQWPLCELMLWLIGPTDDVRHLAATYFYIVVWGTPASLGLFALTGWLIGMQNTRLPMVISIMQNVVNILASLLLVYGLDMKIEGVALGTVIAQYAGLLTGIVLLVSRYGWLWRDFQLEGVFLRKEMVRFFQVNRDIFLRTVLLVAVNLYFTSAGARQGAVVLAVNTLLMQLYLLFSYIMDGFAYAGEALGGRYWGAGDMPALRAVVRRLFGWAALMTVLFSAVYILGGVPFLRLLTDDTQVAEAARSYIGWAWFIPVAGVAAFVWDGVFVGITLTRGMLWSSSAATLAFFLGVKLFIDSMGNHGLWLSMLIYLLMRGLVQTVIFCRRRC